MIATEEMTLLTRYAKTGKGEIPAELMRRVVAKLKRPPLPSMPLNVTLRQVKTMRAWKCYVDTHGHNPTLQAIASVMGVSRVTIYEHVKALLKKHCFTRNPNVRGGYTLIVDVPDAVDDRIMP